MCTAGWQAHSAVNITKSTCDSAADQSYYLQQTTAQAVWLITNAPIVQEGPHHAQNGPSFVVADGVKERLNPSC